MSLLAVQRTLCCASSLRGAGLHIACAGKLALLPGSCNSAAARDHYGHRAKDRRLAGALSCSIKHSPLQRGQTNGKHDNGEHTNTRNLCQHPNGPL